MTAPGNTRTAGTSSAGPAPADPAEEDEAVSFARRFLARGPERLLAEDRADRRLRRTVRRHWGPALDAYRLVLAAVLDLQGDLHAKCSAEAAARQDAGFEALSRLQARAVQLARDVHDDLDGGFVDTAFARWRGLHEVSVIAQVLAEFGRVPAYTDLSERFLLHDIVHNAGDARLYQEHYEKLGWESLSTDTIARIEATRDELVHQFGEHYAFPYGWAIGLPGMEAGVNQNALYRLAEIHPLHPLHRWSGHFVQSDARSAAFTVVDLAEGVRPVARTTTSGLDGPACWAMDSLFRCTAVFALYAPPAPSPDLLCVGNTGRLDGIEILIDHAAQLFDAADVAERRATARNLAKQRTRPHEPADAFG
ncbi:DUF5677 domain-containing protein [Kitasatospora sp. NPDC058406]|uniref:DUF5677 domain-containing protein n=1 Tax=Kitasatospora sp. NPDC058406 TaxID=3346483 RepID=UPI00365E56EE